MKYMVGQAVKAGLVSCPLHWPGPSSIRAMLYGESIKATWLDRTKMWEAEQKGHKVRRQDFEEHLELKLVPFPAFAHLEPEEYRALVREIMEEVMEEARVERAGKPVLGRKKVLERDPFDSVPLARTPKPKVHAGSRESRRRYLKSKQDWCKAYWAASEALTFELRSRCHELRLGEAESL